MLSFVFSWGPGLAASIPVEHDESPLTLQEVAPYIQQLLTCSKPKTFHNAKFDLKVLRRKGWDVERLAWDTMLGEHLLAEAKKGYYDLKSMTQSFLPKYGGYEDELQAVNRKRLAEYKATLPSDPDAVKLTGAAKKMADDFGFEFVPLKHLNVYGAIDADVTRQLTLIQRKRMITEQRELSARRKKLGTNKYFQMLAAPGIKSPEPLKDLMFQQLLPVTHTLARMEETGMRVDREYVLDLAEKMDKSMREYKIELLGMLPPHTLGSQEFNPKSVAQLRKILFGAGYAHPVTGESVCHTGVIPEEDIPRTDTGLISTNAKFLRVLKNQYDCRFSNTLLKYRALTKARDTFIENILVLSEEDGRMHTTFNIHGTATGRLSSRDENMQNIPKKIGNHNLKRCFIPTDPDNQVIMNADAKAAEVRIYAAYSRDKNLIVALNDGLDPHSFFSSKVLNPATILDGVSPSDRAGVLLLVGIDDTHDWSYEDFQKRGYYIGTEKNPGPDVAYGQKLDKLRSNIKRVVFGILYGAAPKKISSIVGIPEAQAAAIIESLFRMFPTIPEYISRTKEKVQYLGTVETFFGRRRRFNLRGMTFKMRNKAERQAVNMLIQSTSSEIIMRVICSVDEAIRHDFGGNLLITVHDSLVAEIPKKYISQMPDFIQEYGVAAVNQQYSWLPVPFLWDVEVGPSYGQLSDVDKYLAGNAQETAVSEDDYLEHEIKSDFEKLAQ
jgi:DNA polymerase I-like protein with 3'-5' exonuclease and polymerase domains